MILAISGFRFFKDSYLLIMVQSSFNTKFRIAEPFSLDYVLHFCKTKKGISSLAFTVKILLAETFSCY